MWPLVVLLMMGLAGLVTAVAVEHAGYPGWIGFVLGALLPFLAPVSALYLVVVRLFDKRAWTVEPAAASIGEAAGQSSAAQTLHDHGPLSAQAAAARLGVTEVDALRQLRELERHGFVVQVPEGWRLTVSGAQQVAQAARA